MQRLWESYGGGGNAIPPYLKDALERQFITDYGQMQQMREGWMQALQSRIDALRNMMLPDAKPLPEVMGELKKMVPPGGRAEIGVYDPEAVKQYNARIQAEIEGLKALAQAADAEFQRQYQERLGTYGERIANALAPWYGYRPTSGSEYARPLDVQAVVGPGGFGVLNYIPSDYTVPQLPPIPELKAPDRMRLEYSEARPTGSGGGQRQQGVLAMRFKSGQTSWRPEQSLPLPNTLYDAFQKATSQNAEERNLMASIFGVQTDGKVSPNDIFNHAADMVRGFFIDNSYSVSIDDARRMFEQIGSMLGSKAYIYTMQNIAGRDRKVDPQKHLVIGGKYVLVYSPDVPNGPKYGFARIENGVPKGFIEDVAQVDRETGGGVSYAISQLIDRTPGIQGFLNELSRKIARTLNWSDTNAAKNVVTRLATYGATIVSSSSGQDRIFRGFDPNVTNGFWNALKSTIDQRIRQNSAGR